VIAGELEKRNVELLGLGIDSTYSRIAWVRNSVEVTMRLVVGATLMALAGAVVALGQSPDPRIAQGKQILGELNPRCTLCHLIDGHGNPKGAVLDDVGSRYTVDELKSWLRTPAEMAKKHGKTRKPAMVPFPELDDQELDAVATYLSSLKKPAAPEK
jgi:mono/diheme cytochrome c family protein